MPAKTNVCLELVREGLLRVGHRRERLTAGISGPGLVSIKQGFVAYADRPFDARTSTFAAVDMNEVDEPRLASLRVTGAPVIAQCAPTHALMWKQSAGNPQFIERVEASNVLSFFERHRNELAPGPIYRAKLWGRTNRALQLDMFVDGSLLPLVEQTAGEDLRKLLEGAVRDTKSALGWKHDIAKDDGEWLLKAVFWLLAAKILKDKGVRGFTNVALGDVSDVYDTLAKHYNRKNPRPVPIADAKCRQALVAAASIFQKAAHMGAVTTESLAWVYESALIDKLTRQELGTHSTPTWLVDDIVAKLRPWIEEMPVDDRWVFEPACGHAGFLISAMRLLSELLPAERSEERKEYLRERLRGIEIDSFAHEIARLSLTLADVPNGNGWHLDNADMFDGDILRSAVAESTIVLANPPFEKFGETRPQGSKYFNRADETFRHILEALPIGGIFGVVLPQTFLHGAQSKALRTLLLDEYDISDVTLFADKVFNYGESETAVLLGRRVGRGKVSSTIRYRRVREPQIETYKNTLEPSSSEMVERRCIASPSASLLVPEVSDVWRWLHNYPTLGQFIRGGKGFEHKGQADPTLPTTVIRESSIPTAGLVKGFGAWNIEQLTHELPAPVWLNLDESVIRRPLHGLIRHKKQILVNYGRVSRQAWRLKGLLDETGHPVTSLFLVYRPATPAISLEILWAMFNSPIANAYAHSHSLLRVTFGGTLEELPVFPLNEGPFDALESAVSAYFKAAKGARPVVQKKKKTSKSVDRDDQLLLDGLNDGEDTVAKRQEELKYLHWRIDAEVLRLYGLPAWAERKILDLFTGVRRHGVPFIQDCYFPKGFNHLERLSDLLAITADWEATNERRCHLIRKDVKKQLTGNEPEELQRLEFLADARCSMISVLYPRKPNALELLAQQLKKEGRWIE